MVGNVWDPGNNRMLPAPAISPPSSGTEMDAARALAELARMALKEAKDEDDEEEEEEEEEDDGDDDDDESSCLKKRNVNGRAAPADQLKNEHVVDYPEEKDVKLNLGVDMNVDLKSESTSSQAPSYGGRSKQALTEDEKEAKRMRRILANRESARQTIRRRQALREELIKKVTDLSLDNQNIKMEKEQILKEYQTLKNTNKQLKEQMAKATRREIEPANPDLELTLASTSTPPVKIPQPAPSSSAKPTQTLAWPSWPPHFPPNLIQFHEKGSSSEGCSPTVPYHLPYCWFFPPFKLPFNDAASSSSRRPVLRHEDYTEGFAENKPLVKEAEAAVLKKDVSIPVRPVGLLGALSEGMTSTSSPVSPSNHITKVEEASSKDWLKVASAYSANKSADAAAAAEARKRRMELTKLKRLHGKSFKHQHS